MILTCCTVVCMGPYSVFALGSGYAFSHAFDHIAKVLAVGTACVFVGAWCGANIAFVLGRFCCRKRVLKFSEKKPILRAIDKVVLKEGLKLIILMRMSLLIPFNFSNYIFGCSAIKYWQFALGTLGVLPLVCFLVYMGTTFSNLQDAISGKQVMSTEEIIVMCVGTVIAALALLYATCKVRSVLKAELD